MDAENALKLVIPVQAERALFISNLGQGRSPGGFQEKPPRPTVVQTSHLYCSRRQPGMWIQGCIFSRKIISPSPPL